MFSFKSITLIVAALAINVESSAVPLAAPLVAPAQIGYAHAVPQNIPPYASQYSVVNKALSPYTFAGPIPAPYAAAVGPAAFAAPLAAGPAPLAAPFAGPLPASYVAGPYAAPYVAPFAAPYAAPYSYPIAPSANLLRTPFGVAPTFVR